MDSFGYKLALAFLLLGLLLIVTCVWVHCRPDQPSETSEGAIYRLNIRIGQGLDESTVHSFPNLLYSEVKEAGKNGPSNVSCPICLFNYEETDRLRLLPDCDHLFHLHCVDQWLRLHATCPLCRNSPAPVVQPTVSLEVAVALPASSAETTAPIV